MPLFLHKHRSQSRKPPPVMSRLEYACVIRKDGTVVAEHKHDGGGNVAEVAAQASTQVRSVPRSLAPLSVNRPLHHAALQPPLACSMHCHRVMSG